MQYKFQAPLAEGRKIDTYSFFYMYALFLFDLKHDENSKNIHKRGHLRIRSDQLKILKRSVFEKTSKKKPDCCSLRRLW